MLVIILRLKMLGSREAPTRWEVQSLFQGLTNLEIAEKAAEFFNGISQEFKPVRQANFLHKKKPPEMYEISAALRACKKPKSMVTGDIDRRLVAKFVDILAIPLYTVYSQVYDTLEWPSMWATETVHLILKTTAPDSLKQLRNLSCTPLFLSLIHI